MSNASQPLPRTQLGLRAALRRPLAAVAAAARRGSGPTVPPVDRDSARLRRRAAWALATLNLAALTVVVTDLAGLDAPDPVAAAPLWLVVALFVLVEAAVVRLEIGGLPVVLVLRATPMLVGLAYLAPAEVIAAHVVGSTIAVLGRRGRPSPVRAMVIVAANAVGTAAAAVVFLALLPGHTSMAGWWAAGCVAAATANAVATPAAIARWAPPGRTLPPGALRPALAYGLLASLVDASFAITVVLFLRTDASELWLLAGPALVAIASYRAWVGLRRRHTRVELLYACARILDGPASSAAMLDGVLALVRDALHADEAVLLLDEGRERRLRAAVGPGSTHRLLAAAAADPLGQHGAVLTGPSGALLRRGRPVSGVPGARATVDAIVIRIDGGPGIAGSVATIGRSWGRPFEAEDARLLETVAQAIGGALASRRLIEELGASVADLARLGTPEAVRAAVAPAADDARPQDDPQGTDRGPLAVGIVDGAFAWSRVNPQLCAMLGAAAPRDLVGRRFEADLAPDDVEAAHGLVSRQLRGESRGSVLELHFRRLDGEGDVIASFLARPLTAAGRDTGVLCVLVDVTATRRAEARERDLAARVDAAILELTAMRRPEVVLETVVRASREVTGATVAMARFGPSRPGQPGPAGVRGIAGGADLALLDEPGRPHLRIPLEVSGMPGSIELLRDAGDPPFEAADMERAARLAAQAVVSIDNARLHERALLLVAELDAANASLRDTQEARSRFLANVSHELRTPLHAILISAQLLTDPTAVARDPGRVRSLPLTIDRTGRHMLGLIDDLVDLSRMELRDLPLSVVHLELEGLLDDVRRQVEPLAEEREIHLSVATGAGIRIEADPLRIRQVLLNLLGNAIKYTGRGGRVLLTAEVDRSEVRVRVQDTGGGIAPEHLERIFLPFERLASDGTPGAGLGLPIARRIAELHGGSLHATSAPGLGSVFTVRLPIVPGVAQRADVGTPTSTRRLAS